MLHQDKTNSMTPPATAPPSRARNVLLPSPLSPYRAAPSSSPPRSYKALCAPLSAATSADMHRARSCELLASPPLRAEVLMAALQQRRARSKRGMRPSACVPACAAYQRRESSAACNPLALNAEPAAGPPDSRPLSPPDLGRGGLKVGAGNGALGPVRVGACPEDTKPTAGVPEMGLGQR